LLGSWNPSFYLCFPAICFFFSRLCTCFFMLCFSTAENLRRLFSFSLLFRSTLPLCYSFFTPSSSLFWFCSPSPVYSILSWSLSLVFSLRLPWFCFCLPPRFCDPFFFLFCVHGLSLAFIESENAMRSPPNNEVSDRLQE